MHTAVRAVMNCANSRARTPMRKAMQKAAQQIVGLFAAEANNLVLILSFGIFLGIMAERYQIFEMVEKTPYWGSLVVGFVVYVAFVVYTKIANFAKSGDGQKGQQYQNNNFRDNRNYNNQNQQRQN